MIKAMANNMESKLRVRAWKGRGEEEMKACLSHVVCRPAWRGVWSRFLARSSRRRTVVMVVVMMVVLVECVLVVPLPITAETLSLQQPSGEVPPVPAQGIKGTRRYDNCLPGCPGVILSRCTPTEVPIRMLAGCQVYLPGPRYSQGSRLPLLVRAL